MEERDDGGSRSRRRPIRCCVSGIVFVRVFVRLADRRGPDLTENFLHF